MCASTPVSVGRWKCLFLVLETFVICCCLYGLALRIAWPYNTGEHPHLMTAYRVLSPWLRPMIWSFIPAVLFLLVVSPFFLRTLRATAIRAWLIGVAAFLGSLLLVFYNVRVVI